MSGKDAFLTLRLPASLVAALDESATLNGRKRSQEHRAAIEYYLDGSKGRTRSLGNATEQERRRAHAHVAKAIRDGALVRKPCEVCGRLPTIAHHEQYERPLDVVWLCQVHHTLRHHGRTLDQLREVAA